MIVHRSSGQSTLEFALITFAFLSLLVALSALWNALSKGVFQTHVVEAASHVIQSEFVESLQDIVVF